MKIALDTNVIVSGLLAPFGPSGEIMRIVASGDLQLCYDVRITSEYKDVLLRPKFSFNSTDVGNLLAQIETRGFMVTAAPLTKRLPDQDDEPFLEIAIGGKAQYLVTGNLKDYPFKKRQGVLVVSPKEFLEVYRKRL